MAPRIRLVALAILGVLFFYEFQALHSQSDKPSLGSLLRDWKYKIPKIQEEKQKLDKQIDVVLTVPQIEPSINETQENLKKLNQEMKDLESNIDQKITDSSPASYKEYWDVIKSFRSRTGADVMTYWNVEEDTSTRF